MTEAAEKAWGNFARRIRQRSPVAEQGQAVVSVSIVVLDDLPILWSKPQVVMVEPGACDLTHAIEAQSIFGEDREMAWVNFISQIRACVPSGVGRATVAVVVAICGGMPVDWVPPKVALVAAGNHGLTETLSVLSIVSPE